MVLNDVSIQKACAKITHIAEAQERVNVDHEGESVLNKWMELVPEEIKKQHNRGADYLYLSGLTDYDYSEINWISFEKKS